MSVTWARSGNSRRAKPIDRGGRTAPAGSRVPPPPAGGGVAGRILKDNELRPYNENIFLEDWAWQFAASSAELASGWVKGGAGVAEDALNYLTPQGILLFAQPTKKNLERHQHPSERFLLDSSEIFKISESLSSMEILHVDEGWRKSERHEAWLVCKKIS